MTHAERGAYIDLLAFAWREESLPDDIDALARLVGVDPLTMAEWWNRIGPCWKPNGSGRLVNDRLERERRSMLQRRRQRSEAGKKGARNRWAQTELDSAAIALPLANDNLASASASASTTTDYSNDFEDFWNRYPKRAGSNPKRDAWKNWQARLREGHAPEELHAGRMRYTKFLRATGKIGTEYVLRAATFLGPSKHFENDYDLPAEEGEVEASTRRFPVCRDCGREGTDVDLKTKLCSDCEPFEEPTLTADDRARLLEKAKNG